MRDRILSRVLLPEPLRPINPIDSPSPTSNETSFKAKKDSDLWKFLFFSDRLAKRSKGAFRTVFKEICGPWRSWWIWYSFQTFSTLMTIWLIFTWHPLFYFPSHERQLRHRTRVLLQPRLKLTGNWSWAGRPDSKTPPVCLHQAGEWIDIERMRNFSGTMVMGYIMGCNIHPDHQDETQKIFCVLNTTINAPNSKPTPDEKMMVITNSTGRSKYRAVIG